MGNKLTASDSLPNYISDRISFIRIVITGLVLVLFSQVVSAETRVALVIGNSKYEWSPLPNPVNDATDMGQTLRKLGFEVDVQLDVSRVGMHRAIRAFGDKLSRADVGLFYYAGHGLQVNGRNFLVPIGADIRAEDEIAFETIDASRVLAKMETAKNPVNIVVLDACRNNPFAVSSRSGSRGLARMESPVGSMLLYATAPNKTASDGSGGNGVFTENLIRNLKMPGLTLDQVVLNTRVGVMADTGNEQVPWSASSLTRNLVLNQVAALSTPATETAKQSYANSAVGNLSKPLDAMKPGIDTDGLLRICERHFLANRLTTGAGGSALDCYKKVFEMDPYNIAALEGIDRIAIKYVRWAERALEANRYSKATQHIDNLKMVNLEHPQVEILEDAVRQAKGFPVISSDSATNESTEIVATTTSDAVTNPDSTPVQVATTSPEVNTTTKSEADSTALYQSLFGSSDAVSSSSTTTNADQSSSPSTVVTGTPENDEQWTTNDEQQIDNYNVGNYTTLPSASSTDSADDVSRNKVVPAEIVNSNEVKSNEVNSDEANLVEDAETETQPPVKDQVTVAVTESGVTTTPGLLTDQPAAEAVAEDTEIVVALADPTPTGPPELCPECFQPSTLSGEPCVKLEVLESAFVRSETNSCHTMIEDTCMDVQYKFRIYNICRKSMSVNWRFTTRSEDVIDGKSILRKKGDATVTCLHKEQDCAGRIRYAWDFTKK